MSPSRRRAIGAVRGLASRALALAAARLPAPRAPPSPRAPLAAPLVSRAVGRDAGPPGLPARAAAPHRPRWITAAVRGFVRRAPRPRPVVITLRITHAHYPAAR